MPTLTIDGREITVEAGTKIIQAADRLGIDIPRFCYHPGLSVAANCRMCLVEHNKSPKLAPSCYDACADGMVVQTRSPKVLEARRAVLEYILLNHPVDCPICDQAGECDLQDLYFAHDHKPSRHLFHKGHKEKARPMGPEVMYDGERCINCTRCVRFCNEVAKAPQLQQVFRGEHAYIDHFPDQELDHPYSMCTADVCPVGALTTRDFRFKCRVWFLEGTASVCGECSRGCSVRVDTYRNAVQRVVPRENPQVNQYWACDAGRLAYHRFETGRLAAPRVKGEAAAYAVAVRETAEALNRTKAAGGAVGVLLSPWMTCEDILAAVTLVRSVSSTGAFAVGGRAAGFQDDVLIRADKNPNRAGVLAVLKGLGIAPVAIADLAAKARATDVLLVFGDEHEGAEALAPAVKAATFSAVFAALDGALPAAATVAFPAASPYEAEGTWVNESGVAQQVRRAVRPAGDARSILAVLADVADRRGEPLPARDAAGLRNVLAAQVAAFAGLAGEGPGLHGTKLGDGTAAAPANPTQVAG